MEQSDFYLIFNECVAQLRQGVTLDECLLDYPEQAEELAPALATMIDLMQLTMLEPSAEVSSQGFVDMMAALDEQSREQSLGLFSLFQNRFSQWRSNNIMKSSRFVFQAAMLTLMLLVAGS
ncbi:MAG: hypothetical protein GWP17_01000, partial [Aquificales bacterium]|nr:hypothetical protein [Aquificales bacterium]